MKKVMFFVIVVSFLLSACGASATPTAAPVVESTEAPVVEATSASTEAPVVETVHIKIGYQPFLSANPLFIAVDDGYFAEQGLEVELIRFTSAGEMLPALLAGEIDLMGETLTAGTINAVVKGEGFKFVAEKGFIDPNAECSFEAFVARKDLLKDGFMDDANNVKGLRFAYTPSTIFEYGLDVQLANMGLTQADVQSIDMPKQPDRLAALSNNAVDVVTFAEPWVARAKNSGAADVWLPFEDVVPNVPISVFLYGPSLTKNTDVGNRFMIAYLKAVKQYNEGKTDRNIEIVSKYTELSPEDLKAACWPSMTSDGSTNFEAWQLYQEWLVEKGYLDVVTPAEQLWDSQFIDFANKAIE